jgi:hypothetical protein
MATELFRRETMQTAQARNEYVGALLEEERRLMLVPLPEEKPWEAFRQLRKIMRRRKTSEAAIVGIFESAAPIEHQADVIPLESRRRAG